MPHKYKNKMYAPFLNFLYIHIEKVCVSNVLHSVKVIPIKLATHTLYEQ